MAFLLCFSFCLNEVGKLRVLVSPCLAVSPHVITAESLNGHSLSEISGSHGGETSRSLPKFQRCLLPPPLIALMMGAASTSETSVNFYHTARRNNPEYSHLWIFMKFDIDEFQ
jgi:hypothetical protein